MAELDLALIPGEILEEILSRVPLIDLVSASAVTLTWQRAVSCSLRHLNTVKPWLLIHKHPTTTRRSSSANTILAYDPRSHVWLQIRQPSLHYFSPLRSSHSSLLYMFSSSRFVFSVDPLHLTWQEAGTPIGWRPDPIVAAVGRFLIVAGSASDVQDDLPALEIYDTTSRTVEWCDSMPPEIKKSAASTWLSVAVDEHKMYVSVKSSGVTYWFDPKSKYWCGPYDMRPDGDVFYSVIGFSRERLILVGVTGDAEDVRSVVMWEVKELNDCICKEISKMPLELLEKLKGEAAYLPSISMVVMGDFVFIHNPLEGGKVIMCELGQGGCRWESVSVAGFDDGSRLERLVVSCSSVTVGDLSDTFKPGTEGFQIKVLS